MTKPDDKIPKWLLEQEHITTREFKEGFRRILREVERDVNEFGYCSAYLPRDAYKGYCDITFLLSDLKKQLSQKEWGR